MFSKILIANRGEIACRIIDTCRRLGVGTVAVHSDVDAKARHVAMADEAISLGGATPAESYLRGDAIIDAALTTGAQAIHPGYGFLSENPDLVEAVEKAGLTFIGPSAHAIRAMGLKDAAKALMVKAGVPVVPGYHEAGQDNLAAEADKIGYPVLIKAVAGGGGKGMRRVNAPKDFAQELEAAQTEAQKAFGNAAVLIEKYVSTPRHIEVQVFGDGTKAVHLFERDCSLQRRHQKVIEEAPAPGMTPEMRDAMGQAAVRAAEAVGYAGAGTVEFIVDASDGLHADRFYFMEMNTRLQVEHPVTEAITGVDLVEWQLRVASGEGLPARQEELSITGHSFEARIYAEDVPAGFLPATGTLRHLRFASGARIDTGVREGDGISPHYDPMIAKLTVHGPDRATTLAQLTRALKATQIGGTVTNIGFLAALSEHEGFAAGDVDTGLIERDLAALTAQSAPCTKTRALAAVAALGLHRTVPAFAGVSLWGGVEQTARFAFDEAEEARVETRAPSQFKVTLPDAVHELEHINGAWIIDEAKTAAGLWCDGAQGAVFWGNTYAFTVSDPLDRDAGQGAGDGVTRAPMPGLVRVVDVAAGAQVKAGDRLLVLEAMKMEHALRADADGIVAEVMTSAGDQVTAGAALVRMEADDD
ncbi:biotin carboxylase N-terminal domain-containing protein [Litoreibacter janthinus]|uniref:3-methylcrotonyl-CoA carboxylase alpha subunit n=1 Tax=Litoreibacter janthinus TaxID=670154 RepID=A0A1I6HJI2_9RHOB|nr:biotin carboxylase N-terminal domain-containing protein [Litoreibacter janthinus]SFR54566.1 3-methylcrotonyl-CoA carboxylase alpha subunit [Litoreibacter janthinus]